jgi:hypothetical protein
MWRLLQIRLRQNRLLQSRLRQIRRRPHRLLERERIKETAMLRGWPFWTGTNRASALLPFASNAIVICSFPPARGWAELGRPELRRPPLNRYVVAPDRPDDAPVGVAQRESCSDISGASRRHCSDALGNGSRQGIVPALDQAVDCKSLILLTGSKNGLEADGAQGRDRTTDTAIFSRMLYQLSYLGAARIRSGGAPVYSQANPPCPPALAQFRRIGFGRENNANRGRGAAGRAALRTPSPRPRRRSVCRESHNCPTATD